MSLHPGKQVSATLRLVRLLGRGAMGSVWLADHLTLQSQVAVKFMAPAMAEDQVSVQRFRQEARAAAEIRSPHVVQVFDHGVTDDGQLYIVMELLEGDSLEKRVRGKGALGAAECARIVAQACKALAKAHERGIVHRDIKPSNVFVIDSGGEPFVKLLDFGVAKFSGEQAMQMTAAGNMVGTPAYMSPEQLFHGKESDHRGDLWSLAVVAYFSLTGVRPFEGRTLAELAVAVHRGKARPVTELRNDLPPELDAFFARAFQPDVAARFASARDLARDLEHACGLASQLTSTPTGTGPLQTFPGTVSTPQGPRGRSVLPVVVGAVLALAVAAVLAMTLREKPVAHIATTPFVAQAPAGKIAPAPPPPPAPVATPSASASVTPKAPPPVAIPKKKGDSRDERAAQTLGL